MLAILFDGRSASLQTDYPLPAAGENRALVRVHLAGVCKTDLEVLKGYMGFRGVMGHEFVGTVVQGPSQWLHRRVVAEINCPCGECDFCRRGLGNHCANRSVLGIDKHDGVFAEYVAVPAANLHAVADNVSDEQAVWVEPLAAAFQITRQVPVKPSDRAVVLGDGRLGQLAARVLRNRLRDLTLVGKHPWKLELAEKQGIRTVAFEQCPAKTPDRADLVVDATGSPSGFELAMRLVRPRGTIVLKSTFAADSGLNLAPLVINEVTVVGSRCGPFDAALAALAAGEVNVTDLPVRRFPLAEGLSALAAAQDPRNLKVIVDCR